MQAGTEDRRVEREAHLSHLKFAEADQPLLRRDFVAKRFAHLPRVSDFRFRITVWMEIGSAWIDTNLPPAQETGIYRQTNSASSVSAALACPT